MSLSDLTQALRDFRDERNWAQFHTLRNLIVSLNLEAAELLELTQWKDDEGVARLVEDAKSFEALKDECADILLYLIQIAEKAGIDLELAARNKMVKNAKKYPVEKSHSSNRKYTELKTAAHEQAEGK